ncbi:unnamed protein product [Cunninghamella echinulata]
MGNSHSMYDDYYYDPYYQGRRMSLFGNRYGYMPNHRYYRTSPFNYGYHQPIYYPTPTFSPYYQNYSPAIYYR